jgi:hypothetical protein
MKKWIAFGMGLALMAGLAPRVQAQVPVPPPAAAAAPGFLAQLGDACAKLKDMLCQKCCLVQLLNNMLRPIGGLAGCPISCCPTEPTLADLAKAGAEGAAAAIKKDELECKARRAAVRYLGTVDCHWRPEAAAALIGALRADQCECVRLEAAIALGRGCCCTKETMAALVVTVNGSDVDQNPSENSERVKAAAAVALAHCLSCYAEVKAAGGGSNGGHVSLPAADKKPKDAVATSSRGYTEFYSRVKTMPMDKIVDAANKSIAKTTSPVAPDAVTQAHTGHSVFEIVQNAVTAPTGTSPLHPVASEEEPARAEHGTRSAPRVEPTPVIRRISYVVPATSELRPRSITPVPVTAPVSTPVHVTPPVSTPVSAAQPQVQHSVPATTGVVNHRQMLALLRQSAYPEQRAWAAENVTYFDWTVSPEIVETLVLAARKDSAPSVRVACLRSLAKMNVQTGPVVATVRALKTDADPHVRSEADLALTRLGGSQTR